MKEHEVLPYGAFFVKKIKILSSVMSKIRIN